MVIIDWIVTHLAMVAMAVVGGVLYWRLLARVDALEFEFRSAHKDFIKTKTRVALLIQARPRFNRRRKLRKVS